MLSSPVISVANFYPAITPDSNLIVVPELPTSKARAAGLRRPRALRAQDARYRSSTNGNATTWRRFATTRTRVPTG